MYQSSGLRQAYRSLTMYHSSVFKAGLWESYNVSGIWFKAGLWESYNVSVIWFKAGLWESYNVSFIWFNDAALHLTQ